MAKYCGNIGFGIPKEIKPGVWLEDTVPRKYKGDVIRNIRRLERSDKINDDIDITNELSIVMDPFAAANFHTIKYAEYMGSRWRVNSITVNYPRLNLTLGGLYNADD